tara:strand:+ start:153 stop:485 length:333 start_codon:yes stop_codon:yes gene_type:complete
MARPIKKRATKASYLGSGAGSLKSGTGATAKKPRKTKFPKPVMHKIEWPKPNIRKIERPKKAFGPSAALREQLKSPASGVDKVFKPLRVPAPFKKRKRITTTKIRRRAKR